MSWLLKGNSHTDPDEHFVGTKDEQPLVIRTNEVEAARVDINGNVGIGTTTPQNSLHVGDGTTSITPNRVNVVVASTQVNAGVASRRKTASTCSCRRREPAASSARRLRIR